MKNRIKKLSMRTIAIIAILCMLVSAVPTFAVESNVRNEAKGAYAASEVAGLALTSNKTVESKSVTRYLRGDVITDNVISTGDAVFILRYTVGILELNELLMQIADANADETVNTGDATEVLRMCVGLVQESYIDIVTIDYYSVSYSDGTDEEEIEVPENDTVAENEVYTISETEPVREGYNFLGWNSNIEDSVSADGTYIVFAAGDSFTMPTYDVTLVAIWEYIVPDGHAVTVILNDSFNGVQSIATYSLEIDATITLDETNINLPEGYRFDVPQTQTVTLTDETLDVSTVTFTVYPYTEIEAKDYIIITTASGIDSVRNDLTLNYYVKNDIDMSTLQNAFEPIGWEGDEDVEFTGIFDGNNCHITNFSCRFDGTGVNLGLFAVNSGIIKNIYIETLSYETSPTQYGVFGLNNVGAVAGKNKNLVQNCRVNGNVGALSTDVTYGAGGGVVGNNAEGATVMNCCMYGGVEGFFWIGGVVGKNFGTISGSWFVGGINSALTNEQVASTTSLRNIGGITGGNRSATITNCYSYPINYFKAYQAVGGIAGWVREGNINCCYTSNVNYLTAVDYLGNIIGDEYEAAQKQYNYTIVAASDSLPMGFSATIWNLTDSVIQGYPDLTATPRANVIADIND